jgi:hypothetical protein
MGLFLFFPCTSAFLAGLDCADHFGIPVMLLIEGGDDLMPSRYKS